MKTPRSPRASPQACLGLITGAMILPLLALAVAVFLPLRRTIRDLDKLAGEVTGEADSDILLLKLKHGLPKQLAHAEAIERRAQMIIATFFGIGLGSVLLASIALSRSILFPLRRLERSTRCFREGDFSQRMGLVQKNALGQLARTFNAMAEKLEQDRTSLEKLSELSIRDCLTGLYNYGEFHRHLNEEMERFRRYGNPFSLLMLDIDHFKAVNDTYGHLAGDEALRAIAAVIVQQVRPVDKVARYGGDELAVLLPETTGTTALVTGERIRKAVATCTLAVVHRQAIHLTVSIGIAACPEDTTSEEGLITAADLGLYEAKRTGYNRVCRSSNIAAWKPTAAGEARAAENQE